ncbi:hypothetical protein K505DRAFT_322048 [Melanomma pulvis-pyrius CBS 109.77]|uniref:Uncharacterized protein n=1 Tax=Melanomma pulvis-pyrius CBS 109.77 TaxID=1314802 RepID=A0A6A6XRJ6_9PLEO|nr:hypothetical protein K505DRAFT_322048 [Melanomma pulvis-pyrius CBS 109.77]
MPRTSTGRAKPTRARHIPSCRKPHHTQQPISPAVRNSLPPQNQRRNPRTLGTSSSPDDDNNNNNNFRYRTMLRPRRRTRGSRARASERAHPQPATLPVPVPVPVPVPDSEVSLSPPSDAAIGMCTWQLDLASAHLPPCRSGL